MTQLVEGNYLRINASGLLCITKINYMVNEVDKLLTIMGYINEILFERQYGSITQLMRLPVQAIAIKAFLSF